MINLSDQVFFFLTNGGTIGDGFAADAFPQFINFLDKTGRALIQAETLK